VVAISNPPLSELTGRTTLLIDDDFRNLFAVTSLLEKQGVTVLQATTAKEGIEKLRTVPGIDIVLLDIMMPEMDGYEAATEIRKLEEVRDVPIIALTAKAMPGDREKCVEAGCSDFIPKPVDSERLLSCMRTWLAGKQPKSRDLN
jgi:CheY-like chemotaxis protein